MGRAAKPWYRKTTDKWYATIGGRQVPLAKGEESRAAATLEFHRLKAAEGAETKQRESFPLGGLADMFLSQVRRTCEPHVTDRIIPLIKSFVSHSGASTPTLDVKPYHLTNWIAAQEWGVNTQSGSIQWVKRMFQWAADEGYIDASPIAKVKKPRSVPREMILTGEQADAALSLVKRESVREFMIALRETGCRPRELSTLTVDKINLDAGTWEVIDKNRRKTGRKHRTVYLADAMIELSRKILSRYPEGLAFRNSNGWQWDQWSLGKVFRRLRNNKKLAYGEEFTPYAYRHLYITDALERGVSPATLAELVGHTDMKMIMRVYSKLRHRTNHLREAARLARKTPSVSRPAEESGDARPADG